MILAGTPSTTVGVVMWDNFIYGTDGVQSTSTYFPYMVMEGIAATSTLTPPPLPPPSDLIIDFDEMNMWITPSFSISPNPDWPADPLDFDMEITTSTSLSDSGWIPVAGPTSVIFPDTYLIGIRAKDNYGAVSVPVTTTWNFPSGFAPYILSSGLGYAAQYFSMPATSTLQSIQLFTTNFQTGSKNPDTNYCTLELHDGSLVTQSDVAYTGYGCADSPMFSFASSSPVLSPGRQYQWVFTMHGGGVQLYGTTADTAGGAFSDPSLVNAKFIVNGDLGVLFSN